MYYSLPERAPTEEMIKRSTSSKLLKKFTFKERKIKKYKIIFINELEVNISI